MNPDKNPIDDILKQSFECFEPAAPDVWSAVQQATTASGAAAVTKTAWMVKVLSAVGIAGSLGYGIYIYTNQPTNSPSHAAALAIPDNKEVQQVTSDIPKLEGEGTLASNSSAVERHIDSKDTGKSKQKSAAHSRTAYPGYESVVLPVEIANTPQQAQPNSSVSTQSQSEIKSQPQPNQESTTNRIIQPAEQAEELRDTNSEKFNEQESTSHAIPNVFTPNGDGVNDEFVVDITECERFDMKILSPNGNRVVFETNDIAKHWNGKIQNVGDECEQGVYFYVLKYSTKSGKTRTMNGKIQLMRSN